MFSVRGLRLYFPLEPWALGLSHSPVVLPDLSARGCGTAQYSIRGVLSAWLPISAPPTGLGECFFFNSLVVRLLYSSIFCQIWLFFVFKFVVVLLDVGGGTVCLPTPPSWLEVLFNNVSAWMDASAGTQMVPVKWKQRLDCHLAISGPLCCWKIDTKGSYGL